MKPKAFLIAALLAVFSFTGCNVDPVSIASQIQGKWVLTQADNAVVPTDDGIIITFTSPTRAYVTALVDSDDETVGWAREALADVAINGKTVTLDGHFEDVAYKLVMHVGSIRDDTMICDCKISSDDYSVDFPAVFLRDDVDFNQAIIGTWEGEELRDDDSGLPDGRRCRFEFLQDGTYNYYHQEMDGSWKQSLDEFSYYCCDGSMLFMHWKNRGLGLSARSACWRIEIKNNVMHWNALRVREDGSTYPLSVDFDKV